jgi:predicted acylesterase/phospholipase RssA
MSARGSDVSAMEPPGSERVAFVLTGGASHGAVQVGMLQALTHAGVTPDVVVGVSAGALNGVAFAADPTMATRRRDMARSEGGLSLRPGSNRRTLELTNQRDRPAGLAQRS